MCDQWGSLGVGRFGYCLLTYEVDWGEFTYSSRAIRHH